MFMVKENEAQRERLKKIFRRVEALYGTVPPQMQFLGNIEADYLEEFLTAALRLARHPHIKFDLFTFLRLHIAFREGYVYCKAYNTTMLKQKGYTEEIIKAVVEDIASVPLDVDHQALVSFAIKAIYESAQCDQEDLERLYTMGWSQKDVFDAVEHAGTLFRNGRILTAYALKE